LTNPVGSRKRLKAVAKTRRPIKCGKKKQQYRARTLARNPKGKREGFKFADGSAEKRNVKFQKGGITLAKGFKANLKTSEVHAGRNRHGVRLTE